MADGQASVATSMGLGDAGPSLPGLPGAQRPAASPSNQGQKAKAPFRLCKRLSRPQLLASNKGIRTKVIKPLERSQARQREGILSCPADSPCFRNSQDGKVFEDCLALDLLNPEEKSQIYIYILFELLSHYYTKKKKMNIYIIQLRQSADCRRTEGWGLQGHLRHCSCSGVWVMK